MSPPGRAKQAPLEFRSPHQPLCSGMRWPAHLAQASQPVTLFASQFRAQFAQAPSSALLRRLPAERQRVPHRLPSTPLPTAPTRAMSLRWRPPARRPAAAAPTVTLPMDWPLAASRCDVTSGMFTCVASIGESVTALSQPRRAKSIPRGAGQPSHHITALQATIS